MKSDKKRFMACCCLLAGAAALCVVFADTHRVRERDVNSLALMYINAAPYSLITPIKFDEAEAVPSAVDQTAAIPAAQQPAADRFAEYVALHYSRTEMRP